VAPIQGHFPLCSDSVVWRLSEESVWYCSSSSSVSLSLLCGDTLVVIRESHTVTQFTISTISVISISVYQLSVYQLYPNINFTYRESEIVWDATEYVSYRFSDSVWILCAESDIITESTDHQSTRAGECAKKMKFTSLSMLWFFWIRAPAAGRWWSSLGFSTCEFSWWPRGRLTEWWIICWTVTWTLGPWWPILFWLTLPHWSLNTGPCTGPAVVESTGWSTEATNPPRGLSNLSFMSFDGLIEYLMPRINLFATGGILFHIFPSIQYLSERVSPASLYYSYHEKWLVGDSRGQELEQKHVLLGRYAGKHVNMYYHRIYNFPITILKPRSRFNG